MSLYEHGIELLGSIKALNLLSGSVSISFSRRTLFLIWLISYMFGWLLYWFASWSIIQLYSCVKTIKTF